MEYTFIVIFEFILAQIVGVCFLSIPFAIYGMVKRKQADKHKEGKVIKGALWRRIQVNEKENVYDGNWSMALGSSIGAYRYWFDSWGDYCIICAECCRE